ncbi:acyltransferase [Chryseolinea sp. Jin1]|uniref:Acyltransferase n=2 Tax=Chryseolinea lacunae TaxID=2801331 RepID=A0ABS1KXP6_9BACT|nr:acyltransferase [Chryseolinea lacunae]
MNGLALHPNKSLIRNIGLDNTGTNSTPNEFYEVNGSNPNVEVNRVEIEQSVIGTEAIKSYYRLSESAKKAKPNKLFKVVKGLSIFYKLPLFILELYKKRELIIYSKKRLTIKGAFISPLSTFHFDDARDINFGKGCYVGEFTTVWVINNSKEVRNSCLIVGDNTYIGEQNNIRASGGKISIGKNCLISQQVSIIAANHEYKKEDLIRNQPWSRVNNFVSIGDDVWVGCGVQILAGVTIGNGAVVAAGSVVTKDVDPYTIVAGVPAKKVNSR